MSHDVAILARRADLERARAAAVHLRLAGWSVHCFWEDRPSWLGEGIADEDSLQGAINDWERTDPEHPAATARYLRLSREKTACMRAVAEAACAVLIEPAGVGSAYLAGFALGQDVSVVRLRGPAGATRPDLTTFDLPATARPDDLDDLAALVHACIGRPALPREFRCPDPITNARGAADSAQAMRP